MNKKDLKYIFIVGCFLFASCKVTQPYQVPGVNTSQLFRDSLITDTNTISNLPYHQLFSDTILHRLIATGISYNRNLRMAYARIRQSRAYYLQSRAAFLPTLNASSGVTRSKFADASGFGPRDNATQFQLGLTTSWEADIWGRLSSSRRANFANLLQTEAAARAVQTEIVAGISNYYFALLALDQQLAITQQTVINWDTTVQTMRALKEAARVTEAAVVQSEAQRYAAEVTIPDLKQSIRETENALSILVGSAPSQINRSSLQEQEIMRTLQTGVPAQLLSNRPDVQQAELNFRYFFELTNVARTNFYPSLTLSSSVGLNALSISDLFKPAAIAASVGAGLTQPIFNQRLNKTRLTVAESQQQEALLNFENTLLIAGQEVSDAISLYETAMQKISIRTNQMTALQRSVQYSQELLRYGFANYTEIITARLSLLQAELGGVNDRLQALNAIVNLYRSLGGGWRE